MEKKSSKLETPSVGFRIFRGKLSAWASLFREAAEAAKAIGARRLISISHSADAGEGVVVVWYWSRDPHKDARKPPSAPPPSVDPFETDDTELAT